MILMLPKTSNINSSWLGRNKEEDVTIPFNVPCIVPKTINRKFWLSAWFCIFTIYPSTASTVLPVVITQDNKTIYTLIAKKEKNGLHNKSCNRT